MNPTVPRWLVLFGLCLSACGGSDTKTLSSAPNVGPVPMNAGESSLGGAEASPQSGRLLFVSASANKMEDGGRDTPFSSVSGAYLAASPGDIVHLLPGTHDDFQLPPMGVRVQGSGADVTFVPGPLTITQPNTRISHLTIRGGHPGLTVESPTLLEAIGIDQSEGIGLLVLSEVQADDVSVSNTSADEMTQIFEGPVPTGGAGVRVAESGQLSWSGGQVTGTQWTGIYIEGSTTLNRVTIANAGGPAVAVVGGHLDAEKLRLADMAAAGILMNEGVTTVSDVTIQTVQTTDIVPLRAGIVAYGGTLTVSDARIENANRGLRLARGAVGTLSNVSIGEMDIDGVGVDDASLIIDTLDVMAAANTGVSAVAQSTVTGIRLSIGESGRAGLFVSQSEANIKNIQITAGATRAITFLRAHGQIDGFDIGRVQNVGIQVTDPQGPITIMNGKIYDVATSGIAVDGDNEVVHIQDVEIEGTRMGEAELGEGIHAYEAHVHLRNVGSSRNAGAGLLVERSTLQGQMFEADDNLGPGIVWVESTTVESLDTISVRGNAGYGILQLGGQLALSNLEVMETRSDLSAGTGDGIFSSLNAELILSGTPIKLDRNQNHGLSVDSGSTAHVRTDVSARGNGGFGLYSVCGRSTLTLDGVCRCEDNRQGDQNMCL
ncbi:MAG: right-handed parallel beta-helix repeat-containing protein [Myxococcota bacterium]|nr:right-handed parallel beta-helix repeat-containing protein [Myxococcota bacterium]